MNSAFPNLIMWALATLVLVAAAVTITLTIARKRHW